MLLAWVCTPPLPKRRQNTLTRNKGITAIGRVNLPFNNSYEQAPFWKESYSLGFFRKPSEIIRLLQKLKWKFSGNFLRKERFMYQSTVSALFSTCFKHTVWYEAEVTTNCYIGWLGPLTGTEKNISLVMKHRLAIQKGLTSTFASQPYQFWTALPPTKQLLQGFYTLERGIKM